MLQRVLLQDDIFALKPLFKTKKYFEKKDIIPFFTGHRNCVILPLKASHILTKSFLHHLFLGTYVSNFHSSVSSPHFNFIIIFFFHFISSQLFNMRAFYFYKTAAAFI